MLAATTPNLSGAERVGAHPYQPTPNTACLAIVWVDGLASEAEEEMLLDTLSGSIGVNQATFSLHKPDLLVVDYDRQQTKALDLLERINSHNIRAKIVGC